MGRIRGPFFKQALDEFEANLVEEVILTLPISRYFEPDDEGDLATVHTSIVSAHETLVEIDAVHSANLHFSGNNRRAYLRQNRKDLFSLHKSRLDV